MLGHSLTEDLWCLEFVADHVTSVRAQALNGKHGSISFVPPTHSRSVPRWANASTGDGVSYLETRGV